MVRLIVILGLIALAIVGLWILLRKRDAGNPAATRPPLSDHDEAEDATVPARLEELDEMRRRGEITEDEYRSRRRHLLGDEEEDEE